VCHGWAFGFSQLASRLMLKQSPLDPLYRDESLRKDSSHG
jgi:hypothetical protein